MARQPLPVLCVLVLWPMTPKVRNIETYEHRKYDLNLINWSKHVQDYPSMLMYAVDGPHEEWRRITVDKNQIESQKHSLNIILYHIGYHEISGKHQRSGMLRRRSAFRISRRRALPRSSSSSSTKTSSWVLWGSSSNLPLENTWWTWTGAKEFDTWIIASHWLHDWSMSRMQWAQESWMLKL